MSELKNAINLPLGWCKATLEEIAEINPSLPTDGIGDETDVSFLPMKAVEEESGKFDSSNIRSFGQVKRGYTPFVDDDVIFAKITPCMENGKAASVKNLMNGIGFGSTEFHVLRPERGLISKYLFFYLIQKSFRQEAQSKMTGSAGQKRVPAAFIERSEMPLPPTTEQRRIVSSIEEPFTKLDAGVQALRHAQTQLKRYRQAVLKAAVTGELIKDWREAHQSELESASELLARILKEHRAKWEADQLARMKREGKTLKNDDWKERYPEPRVIDQPPDDCLPEGWAKTNVDYLSVVVRGASPRPAGSPKYFGGNIAWITVGSLTADNKPFLHSISEFVTEAGHEASRYIEPDTLLLTNSGATPGVPKITMIGGCINDGSVALLYLDYPLKLYVYYYLAEMTKRLRRINQGAAQPNLNTSIVKAIPISLPPTAEQQEIVSEVERLISIADAMEESVDQNLKQAERMRQSILKGAFEGKLVAQDPNDEAAELLLERIKQERAKREAEKRATSKPTRRRFSRKQNKRTEGAIA